MIKFEKTQDARTPSIEKNDIVKVVYRGTLDDGTEFDSSYKNGRPAVFNIGNVIKGWQEGLAQMRPGDKAKFIIPPEDAYGDKEVGKIPANSTLTFEVELLEIINPDYYKQVNNGGNVSGDNKKSE